MVCSGANMDQLERVTGAWCSAPLYVNVQDRFDCALLYLPGWIRPAPRTFDRSTVNRRHCRDQGLWLFYPCSLLQPWQAGCFEASIAWLAPLARVDRSGELARALASVNVPAFAPGTLARLSPSAAPARAAASGCVAAFVPAPPARVSRSAAPARAAASGCVAAFVPAPPARVSRSAASERAA